MRPDLCKVGNRVLENNNAIPHLINRTLYTHVVSLYATTAMCYTLCNFFSGTSARGVHATQSAVHGVRLPHLSNYKPHIIPLSPYNILRILCIMLYQLVVGASGLSKEFRLLKELLPEYDYT